MIVCLAQSKYTVETGPANNVEVMSRDPITFVAVEFGVQQRPRLVYTLLSSHRAQQPGFILGTHQLILFHVPDILQVPFAGKSSRVVAFAGHCRCSE